MDLLMKGVGRFLTEVYPQKSELFGKLAREGQSPKTLIISCADSRVVPELITQSEPGDLFVIRNAGNIVPPWRSDGTGGVTATIEYAVAVLGVTDIVICGHSECGAMKALLSPGSTDDLPAVASWLQNAEAAEHTVAACCGDLEDGAKLDALVEQNVVVQLLHLRSHPKVAGAMASRGLRLHGWVFDIDTGLIRALDSQSGEFVEFDPERNMPVAEAGKPRIKADEAA